MTRAPQQPPVFPNSGAPLNPYQPQFDPYIPPVPTQAYGHGYDQGAHGAGQGAGQAHDPRADLRGPTYDQWPAPQAQTDPRGGWDTAAYQQPPAQPPVDFGRRTPQVAASYQQPASQQPPPLGRQQASPPAHQGAWHSHEMYADPSPHSAHGHAHEPSLDLNSYGLPPTQPGQHAHAGHQASFDPGQQVATTEQDYDAEDEGDYEEIEEPRRGRRWMMIAAALVGAIGVGGGLAYAYKSYMAPSGPKGATPVVKSAAGPAKEKPAEPGGKQFPHQDTKIAGRLNDGGSVSASSSAASTDDGSGTRKVPTLVVGRDGAIAPPAASEAAPAAPPPAAPQLRPTVQVPGMTVVDAFGGRPAVPQGVAPAPQPPPQQPVVVSPPQKPVVIGKAPSAPQPEAPAAAPTPPPAPKKVAVAPPVPPAAASDADPIAAPAAPKAPVAKKVVPKAAAPSAASGGTSGYVAVLASVPASSKSRMEALKQFADMQQKYGSVLANRAPDVQEANLGEKGVYHRLLVGPPASKEQASSVCSQLKAAGYTGCWITAY